MLIFLISSSSSGCFFQVISGAQTMRQVINCKKFLLYNLCVFYIKINRCCFIVLFDWKFSLLSLFFFFFKTTMFVRDEKKLRTEFAACTFRLFLSTFFQYSLSLFSLSILLFSQSPFLSVLDELKTMILKNREGRKEASGDGGDYFYCLFSPLFSFLSPFQKKTLFLFFSVCPLYYTL